jgi:pimeloyl-ACP methyl ester carboxylesterase
MSPPEVWEPFRPSRGVQRREMAGWLNIVRLLGRPVRAVDPRRTDYVPVLLIPGFLSGDWSMIPLARRLRRAGHPTLTSGIVVNTGCTEALLGGLEPRLEQAVEATGRPVAVVGQSRGGTLGRMLASRRPDLVAGLITLGSPLLHQLATTRMVVRQVDALARLNVRGWPWLLSADCLAGGCAERSSALLAAPWPEGLPFTSIYSRGDGVVDWRACLDPAAEQIEVRSTHNGMGASTTVQRYVLSRLAAL